MTLPSILGLLLAAASSSPSPNPAASVPRLDAGPSRVDPIEITFGPEDGTTIHRTFDSDASYDLDELGLLLDGEAPPDFQPPEPDLSIEATEHIVVTDKLEGVADGRPAKTTRHYDALAWKTTYSSGQADEDKVDEDTCDLADHTVVFSWDEDAEGFSPAYSEDDDDGDDANLEHLTEDMDLRSFLPDDAVSEGDSWDLSLDAYRDLVWPGGVLPVHAADEEVDDNQLAMTLALLDGLDGSGEAKLESVHKDDDGVRVAEISFTFSVSTTGSVDIDDGPTLERSLSREVEGTLIWDLDGKHARSLEGSADSTFVSKAKGKVTDPEGNDHDLEQSQTFKGTVTYKAAFEVE